MQLMDYVITGSTGLAFAFLCYMLLPSWKEKISNKKWVYSLAIGWVIGLAFSLMTDNMLQAIAFYALAIVSSVTILTDYLLYLIPKRIQYCGMAVAAGMLALEGILLPTPDYIYRLISAILAVSVGVLMLIFALFSEKVRANFGMGDIRMMIFLGLVVPIEALFVAYILGFILSLAIRIIPSMRGKKIYYGVPLSISALIVIPFYQAYLGAL